MNFVNESEILEKQKLPLRIAVLVSGSGSNLQALIDAVEHKELPNIEIVLVVCNRAEAYGLQRALKHKIPAMYLPWRQREQAEAKLATLLKLFQVDLIVLAGWMRIFNANFITQFTGRIINLHPALIPDDGVSNTYTTSNGTVIPVFRGIHAVQQALDAGVSITGSTVHYVTPEVDAGPAICHAEVRIEQGDTEEVLQDRIKDVEHGLIVEAVKKVTAYLYDVSK